MLCIQTDKLVSDPSRMKLSTEEFYLKSKDQMGELFADIPDALTNTA